MSDAELKQEVTRQLQEAGIENPDIQIQTDENGRRQFKINIPEGNIKSHPNDFELKVKDGGNEEVLKRMHRNSFPEELKGKSDQEIKDWVKQNNKEADLKDSDIQIIRENGDVKIKVVKEDVRNK
jgi:tRNA G37 N-methylase Trm5